MTAPTCDGVCDPHGRCDPKHPTHCCHFMVTYPPGRFGGFACLKCGKKSKNYVKFRSQSSGPVI